MDLLEADKAAALRCDPFWLAETEWLSVLQHHTQFLSMS